jgi:hypothetical protein
MISQRAARSVGAASWDESCYLGRVQLDPISLDQADFEQTQSEFTRRERFQQSRSGTRAKAGGWFFHRAAV